MLLRGVIDNTTTWRNHYNNKMHFAFQDGVETYYLMLSLHVRNWICMDLNFLNAYVTEWLVGLFIYWNFF